MSLAANESAEMKDSFGMYLREIGRTPLLDAEKEVELAKRIEAGLYAQHLLTEIIRPATEEDQHRIDEYEWLAQDGREVKDHFISANLRLTVSLAKVHPHRNNISHEDLVAGGNLGIIRAVEKFDYTKGYKFSTYASTWIKHFFQYTVAESTYAYAVPRDVSEKIGKAMSIQGQLEAEFDRAASPEEVAKKMKEPDVDRVADWLNWGMSYASLDKPIDEESGATLKDIYLGDKTTTGVDADDEYAEVNNLLGKLDDRRADIVRRRTGVYGEKESLLSISKVYGITVERVRQLEKESIDFMRACANEQEPQKIEPPQRCKRGVLNHYEKKRLSEEMQRPEFRLEDYELSSEQALALKLFMEEGGSIRNVGKNMMMTERAAKRLLHSAVAPLEPLLTMPRSA